MVDAANWLVALGAVGVPLVTLLVAAGFLSRSSKLRRAIAADVTSLKDMAPGPANDELGRHITRQVRRLLAEEEPWTPREARLARRVRQLWGYAVGLYLFALGPLCLALTGYIPLDRRSGWLGDGIMRVLALMALIGLLLNALSSRTYEKRKQLLQERAGR